MITKRAILILFLFVALVSSVPNPIHQKRNNLGFVAIAFFNGNNIKGTVTFTQVNSNVCRALVQFNTGFNSANNNLYTFKADGHDITPNNLIVRPPGIAPFRKDFNNFKCKSLVGKQFTVKRGNQVIGEKEIKGV
ncbi:hypothetical protein RclHR1_15960002 [Rhizophagus clarus]|uniref:Uncharacterized protein n=1 Tax=Rhizophagus clarus TaxID=94130 RepID=A0A2Z6QVL3_9GLOM|nr:hypothetical protein RclHR1_15960002 [Rhizophagus clarus]GES88792.1 hypothetical protein GLOIN_2v1604354 [Rhizophagus clarus]